MAQTSDILLNLIDQVIHDKVVSTFQQFESKISKLISAIEKSSNATPDTLNLLQVADYLQLPPATIYKYTSTRKIPHFKIGKHLLFDKNAILEWREELVIKTRYSIEQDALGPMPASNKKLKK